MNTECLFCKIASGAIISTILYQDEHVFAIKDIHPQAPHHLLIVPKRHIATLNDLNSDDTILLGHMVQTAKDLAKQHNEDSYRLVMNCNAKAGQSVFHIHLHLIAGRIMQWPPG